MRNQFKNYNRFSKIENGFTLADKNEGGVLIFHRLPLGWKVTHFYQVGGVKTAKLSLSFPRAVKFADVLSALTA